MVRGLTQRIRFHIEPALSFVPGRARAAERLLPDDRAGRLVVDVEVAGRVAQRLLRRGRRASSEKTAPVSAYGAVLSISRKVSSHFASS